MKRLMIILLSFTFCFTLAADEEQVKKDREAALKRRQEALKKRIENKVGFDENAKAVAKKQLAEEKKKKPKDLIAKKPESKGAYSKSEKLWNEVTSAKKKYAEMEKNGASTSELNEMKIQIHDLYEKAKDAKKAEKKAMKKYGESEGKKDKKKKKKNK